MPRAITTWSDLKIGIAAFFGIAAIAGGVLAFARIGALHGATTTIYMVSNEASGVLQGTEVWLAGKKIGLVQNVRFMPVTNDSTERILIQMQILSRNMHQIRKNSDVQVRPGTSLIAEPVVAITAGTINFPPVREGDTLRALAQLSRQPASVDIASLGDSLIAEAHTIRGLVADVRAITSGPIAQIRRRSEIQATQVNRAINRFSMNSTRSSGTVSLASHDTVLRRGIARVAAQTDSIRLLLANGRRSLGRFRRDSTLLTEARQVLATTEQLRTLLSEPVDPRMRGDSVLARALGRIHVQLDSLIANVRRHPLKYLEAF
jgi:phospholipid/cholesterol/gamma-HCH transport system substrate-binding protein